MEKKPPSARIVMWPPDDEWCVMTPEGDLYQVGGVLLFRSRKALVEALHRLGALVIGDDVWL